MAEITRAIDAIVGAGLAPALAAVGFRKQARTFRRAAGEGEVLQVVQVQGSKWNVGGTGEFTVELGLYVPRLAAALEWQPVASPAIADCMLRRRLGKLMPGARDRWWQVTPEMDHDALAHTVAEACLRFGVPWLDGAAELPGMTTALEVAHEYYLAAVLALELGDRTRSARLIAKAYEHGRLTEGLRAWASERGLLAAPAP